MQKIFLGIPVLNRFDLLDQALDSLNYQPIDLYVVNNNYTYLKSSYIRMVCCSWFLLYAGILFFFLRPLGLLTPILRR